MSGGGDVDAYSPHQLAGQGIVAVNVTSRLGILGYLPIPGIAPANLGLLDQIEALKWIQNNISGFGGDPGSVTLYGQSAGADSIFCLMVADKTDALFQRAILQSLPIGRLDDENRDEMTQAMSEHARRCLFSGDPSTVPIPSLLAEQKDVLGLSRTVSPSCLLPFGPVLGEFPLPGKDQVLDRFIAAAKSRPLFIGYTANEATAFTHIDAREEAPAYLYNLFQGATDDLLRKMNQGLGWQTPRYEVTWYPGGSDALKATHCIELALLLGDWPTWKDAPMLRGTDAEKAIESIGPAMRRLWAAFAQGQDLTGKNFVVNASFHFP